MDLPTDPDEAGVGQRREDRRPRSDDDVVAAGHARGMGSRDCDRQWRDVPLPDPSEQGEHALVEEANRRTDLSHGEETPGWYLGGRTEHPCLDRAAVEGYRHQAPDARRFPVL